MDNPGSWYLAIEGQQEGPMATAELLGRIRDGTVPEQAFVFWEGSSGWTPVTEVPDLRVAFEREPRPPPPPPPPPPTLGRSERPAVPVRDATGGHRKGKVASEEQRRKAQHADVERQVRRAVKADYPREKNVVVAYAILILGGFGALGLHRFYLGKVGTGLLYLFTLGLLGIGVLVDVIRLPHIVRQRNAKVWLAWFDSQAKEWTEVSGVVQDTATSSLVESSQMVVAKQVLNFRVQEFDESGDVAGVTTVELIGNAISGSLRDGDSVRVRGKKSAGGILRALSVDNDSTNSTVSVCF